MYELSQLTGLQYLLSASFGFSRHSHGRLQKGQPARLRRRRKGGGVRARSDSRRPARKKRKVYAHPCHFEHPFSRAHCSTSWWPPSVAYVQVQESHAHPFARAHCNTSRCPPFAA